MESYKKSLDKAFTVATLLTLFAMLVLKRIEGADFAAAIMLGCCVTSFFALLCVMFFDRYGNGE